MKSPSKTIGPADAGQRLDRFLKRVCTGVPFVGLQKAIRTGGVKVNGRKVPMDFRLNARDVVTMPAGLAAASEQSPAYTPTKAEITTLRQAVVHEDAQVLAINKPQGLPAQAGGGQVKSLDRLLPGLYGPDKTPKLVHRLDKETTGLILCGRTRTAAAALSEQWASREVLKGYLALVLADTLPAHGEMQEPIGKRGPQAVIDPEQGDPAHTRFTRLGEIAPGIWAVLAFPLTGRMNQIRVHFAHRGWPLVGDDKYGDFSLTRPAGRKLGTGLALHAWRLKLRHPATAHTLVLEAPLPAAWQQLMHGAPTVLEAAEAAWQRWIKNQA